MIVAAVSFSIFPITGFAQTPVDPSVAFGFREDVSDVSISPDGKSVAFIRAVGARGQSVEVVPVAGGEPKRILASDGKPERVTKCNWSTNTRLFCNIYFVTMLGTQRSAFTRQVAVNADGSGVRVLSANENSYAWGIAQSGGSIIDRLPDEESSEVLMTRVIVPEATRRTRLMETREGLAVERVDTNSGRRRTVEPPRADAVEYISDGHGDVRIMGIQPSAATGYNLSYINYSYRKPGSHDWLPLGRYTGDGGKEAGFEPYAIDRAQNVVYGFDDQNGRRAVFKILLDGSLKRELVFADPTVDVDGLIRIGRDRRVVGVSYAKERRTSVFFDPTLKRLAASLGKALPNLPLVTFIDASADENRLVLFAGSDTDPGRYFVYDKTSRELSELLPARPRLEKLALAPSRPITFPAQDGTQIPGYLTLPPNSDGKNIPAIVMPHGGPGARDEWGFDWLAQFYANRGFAVLQPNFRGSTGYGQEWFQDNGFKSWKVAIGDVNDAGKWLVKSGIAKPDKLAIVGWSYGGYAALQSQVLDPTLFKAVVAIAPVTDLETLRQESVNFTNHRIIDAFIGRGPHVREGSPAQNAERIKAPVLMFHGVEDLNVGVGESRLMAERLKAAGGNVELVIYDKLDHQLDDSVVRTEMLAKSDAFLRKSLGM